MPMVRFYAGLRQITGVKERNIPGDNLRVILEALRSDFPAIQAYLFSGDRVRAIITLNGQAIDPNTALEKPVSGNDMIAIFPPIGGG